MSWYGYTVYIPVDDNNRDGLPNNDNRLSRSNWSLSIGFLAYMPIFKMLFFHYVTETPQ